MVQFDFAKMNLKQIFITFAFSFIFWMCSNNEPTAELLEAFGTPPVVNKITSQEFLEQGEAIFEDGEDIEKTVSSERIFYVQKPVYAEIKNGKLRIFNAMACHFKEVNLWLTMPEMRDTLLLMKFEEIPGFYELNMDSPLKMGEKIYSSKSGQPIRTNNFALLAPSQFELHLECKDSVFNMLKSIKMKTKVQMGKYGHGNWGLMTPNAARYYATSVINMAVMFSSDIFRDSLINYQGSIHGNDGATEIDREALLKAILNKNKLLFGVVTGPGIAGLGGGESLGVREEEMPGFFYQNRVNINCNWILHVWIHEFGHALGYGHSSSLCYGSVPDEIVPKVYRYMMKNKMLPYIINPFKRYNDYNPDNHNTDKSNTEL